MAEESSRGSGRVEKGPPARQGKCRLRVIGIFREIAINPVYLNAGTGHAGRRPGHRVSPLRYLTWTSC